MRHQRFHIYFALSIAFSGFMCAALQGQGAAKYLYVTNETANNISIYSVDATTGQLLAVGVVATAAMPHWIQFSPSGSFAYVVSDDGNAANLTIYAVNAANGSLTSVGSLTLAPATFPSAKITPAGDYLLLTDGRNDQVTLYSLNQTTGIPALVNTFSSPNIPWSVAFANSQEAFVVGNGNQLTTLPLSPTPSSNTALSSSNTTGMTTSRSPMSVRPSHPQTSFETPSAEMVSVHPNGQMLYVTDPIGQTLTAYGIGTAGSLTPVGSPVDTGVSPSDIVIIPAGNFLYLGNWSTGMIAGFALDSSGIPTAVTGSPFSTPFITSSQRGGGVALTIDSSGQFLYATSSDSAQITGFRIDQNSGAISPIAGLLLSTGSHPFRVVAAP